MDAATWQRLKAVVADALARPAGERAQFLIDACPDAALREQAGTLLKYHDTASEAATSFGASPPDVHAADELPLGTRIGPYLVIDRLGGGGMGEVFLGNDTRLHRKVALKRLVAPASAADERARVLQEARAAARVNHPNVATIHDIVEHEAGVFIVMEYVEGESLADRLRRGPLPPDRVVALGRQLAAALTAAHARGIVHRDLKPANIQITPDESVKVLDFGVAQAISLATSASTMTTTTRSRPSAAVGGTPAYMAPEQWLGGMVDRRADIYSLGVILFEMATGRRPRADGGPVETLLGFAEPAPRADAVDHAVSRPLADVIARALEVDADRRFQSAADLSAALDGVLPVGAASAPGFFAFRSWRLAAAAAIVAAVLAGGALWRRRPPAGPPLARTTPVVTVLPFVDEGPQTEAPIAAGIAGVLAADLSTLAGVTFVPSVAAAKYDRPYPYARMKKELGLDYVVTGAVRRPRDRVDVVATLVDLKTEQTRDTATFDAKASDVFGMQAEISAWTIGRIQALTGDSQSARPSRRPATTDASAFEDYAQGRRFIDRRDLAGNVDRAVDVLEDAVRRDPKFALAFAALGEACWLKYDALKDPQWADRAKDATLEALRLDPAQPMVRYALAIIYRGTGRKTDAIDELGRAIGEQPSSDELHRLLGRAYADVGRLDDAVNQFTIAQRLRPGFWDNYRALGLAYFDAGRYADAVSALRRLTELQPDSATGFQMLGTAYHALGDLDQALANYRRTNELHPSPTAWSNIGTIRYGRKDYAGAAAAYRESQKLQPKEPSTLRNLGDALARLGDRPGAKQAYRSAVELCQARLAVERNDARLLALEALCLAKLGEAAKARAVVASALALNPRSPDALYKKAVVLLLDHDTVGALAALRAAIESGYSRNVAAADDDLAPLARQAGFDAIVRESPKQKGGPDGQHR